MSLNEATCHIKQLYFNASALHLFSWLICDVFNSDRLETAKGPGKLR